MSLVFFWSEEFKERKRMNYRCPKHDVVFFAALDVRPPGSPADPNKGLSAHPENGHPECPLCAEGR